MRLSIQLMIALEGGSSEYKNQSWQLSFFDIMDSSTTGGITVYFHDEDSAKRSQQNLREEGIYGTLRAI